MILQSEKEALHEEALLELRSRFKRKRGETRRGKEFWVEPNFQETIFSDRQTPDRIDLGNGYVVLYNEHRPFIETGEYIVTYQIGEKNDPTRP